MIKVKNTYDLPITGKPSLDVSECLSVKQVAVVPSADPLAKPKLVVKEGDKVKQGQVLFFDKKDERRVSLSPGAGTVSSIQYGPRRRLDLVIIDLDAKEEKETFEIPKTLDRDAVVDTLLKGGLWARLAEYPFNRVPKSDVVPPSIYVTVDYDEPFYPESSVYLNGQEDAFKKGIEVLKALTDGPVNIGVSSKTTAPEGIKSIATHTLDGAYPANNPAVYLYYNKKDASENSAWGVRGLDVVKIGQLFLTGEYPVEQTVVVAGDLAKNPRHIKTREGVLYKDLIGDDKTTEPTRYISGGVLVGRSGGEDGALSYQEYALHLIREGKEQEMLTFFRPGFDKPTYSRTYFSALLRQVRMKMTTSLNGGDRSCISCGACPEVCPTEALPQVIMKNLYANDIEEAVKVGLLDCADCGLCTYVCPSKIDLDGILSGARQQLAKEA
jgi:Na+-transporting NADH:ubiquinone oxidoreductase subunit A